MPHQAPKSSCGSPTSAMVGISGASELRAVPVTANARHAAGTHHRQHATAQDAVTFAQPRAAQPTH
jgi:hypothetical protein